MGIMTGVGRMRVLVPLLVAVGCADGRYQDISGRDLFESSSLVSVYNRTREHLLVYTTYAVPGTPRNDQPDYISIGYSCDGHSVAFRFIGGRLGIVPRNPNDGTYGFILSDSANTAVAFQTTYDSTNNFYLVGTGPHTRQFDSLLMDTVALNIGWKWYLKGHHYRVLTSENRKAFTREYHAWCTSDTSGADRVRALLDRDDQARANLNPITGRPRGTRVTTVIDTVH